MPNGWHEPNNGFFYDRDGKLFYVNGVAYPVHKDASSSMADVIYRRVQLRTESGVTISIVWGKYTYGDKSDTLEPATVEIAAWKDGDAEMMEISADDTVAGYVTADELNRFIKLANSSPIKLINNEKEWRNQ